MGEKEIQTGSKKAPQRCKERERKVQERGRSQGERREVVPAGGVQTHGDIGKGMQRKECELANGAPSWLRPSPPVLQ